MEPADAPRPRINVCVVGDSSSAKSSVCGSLVAKTKSIDSRTLRRLKLVYNEHWGHRMPFTAAWVMDKLKRERECGYTVDGNIAQVRTCQGGAFTIFDTPGNPRFAQKAVTFISQSDVGVLCVDAEGPRGLFRPVYTDRSMMYASYLFMFQVRQIIVVVTKMDVVDHSETFFKELSASIRAGLQKVGFTPAQILGIIPVSIRKGPTNIVSSYTKHNNLMPWYVNQNGPSLEDLLMKAKAPERDKDGPALIVFSKSFKIGGVGTVIVGGIIKGTLEQGNMILAVPGFVKRRAASIEVFHQKVRTAHAGDQVGINMKNISYRDFGRSYRGYLVASAKEKLEFVNTSNGSFFSVANGKLREAGQYAHPEHYIPSTEDAANFNIPRASRAFVADILFVRSKLGKRDTPIQVGSTMTLTCRLMSSHVKVANLIAKLDPKTFKPKEFLPSSLHSGDVVRVELVSLHPVPVEEFSRFKALSRVVLADNLSIVGGGVVREMKTLRTRLIVGIGGMLDEKTDFKTRWFGSFLIEFDIQIVSSFWEFFVVSVVLGLGLDSSFDKDDISGLHLLILGADGVRWDMSPTTLRATQSFVDGGGTLLVMAGHNFCESLQHWLGCSVVKRKFYTRASHFSMIVPGSRRASQRAQNLVLHPPNLLRQKEKSTKKWAAATQKQATSQLKTTKAAVHHHKELSRYLRERRKEDAKKIKQFPPNSGGWLPTEMWGLVLRYVHDVRTVCRFSQACKSLDTAGNLQSVWQPRCDRLGISAFFKGTTDDIDTAIAAKCPHKFLYKLYFCTARTDGGALIVGSRGKVNAILSHCTYVMVPVSADALDSQGGSVLATTCAFADPWGALLIHWRRFYAERQGQIIMVTELGFPFTTMRAKNRILALNLLDDAARQQYFNR